MKEVAKAILLSHLPSPKTGRPRSLEYGAIIDSISFVLRTGCQWRYAPIVDHSWKTVYHYFSKWSKQHIFEHAYYDLLRFYTRRGISENIITDTSFVKNVYGKDCFGRSPVDRGRRATKVSALVDEHGIPLQILFHPGNKNDGKTLHHLLQNVSRRMSVEGKTIFGDKAYGNSRCDLVVDRHRMKNRLSRRKTLVDKVTNRIRIAVEHTFGWLDKYRRIILRYDGLVAHFRSFHYLAALNLLAGRIKESYPSPR